MAPQPLHSAAHNVAHQSVVVQTFLQTVNKLACEIYARHICICGCPKVDFEINVSSGRFCEAWRTTEKTPSENIRHSQCVISGAHGGIFVFIVFLAFITAINVRQELPCVYPPR